jgi:hypothetical protein
MNHRRSLTEIANEFGTDKGTAGPTDSWPVHNYTDIYAAYLQHLRLEKINLLEIGLGVVGENHNVKIAQGRNTGGASIKMWQEYFPAANIHGIDINPCSYLDNARTKTWVTDQGSPAALAQFLDACGVEAFDIIIDDGSHLAKHQQVSFGTLFPRLKSGGYYFIEDLLNNGLGGTEGPGLAGADVLCTRTVLKEFANTGKFPEPHAIENAETIAPSIAEVIFHCPTMRVLENNSKLLPPALASKPPHVKYLADQQKLCLVRKR